MKTQIVYLDKDDNEKIYNKAAEIIRGGGLVVFPTETVYGLGADALNPTAVEKIFRAKNRPQDNPLIVHVSSIEEISKVAKDYTEVAETLMDVFFPGPLTLILKKKDEVPRQVSNGLKTVGVRMPSDIHANRFIRACGTPIAAPSANISKKPSITADKYLIEELSGRVDMIMCAGESAIGVESTVLDASGEKLTLLRPGKVEISEIEKVTGKKVYGFDSKDVLRPKSPGMKYAHYMPKTELTVLTGKDEKITEFLLSHENENIGFIGLYSITEKLGEKIETFSLGEDIEQASRRLYYSLREMDKRNVDIIYAQGFETEGLGLAYMNRLVKASGGKTINL